MSAECECGFEAKNERGLAVHQRSCDEVSEDDSPDSDDEAATVSTAVAEPVEAGDSFSRIGNSDSEEYDFDGVEAEAFERDDEECVRCGSVSALTIHRYREGSDALANLVTLCEECDEALSGIHYLSKRDEVNR